MVKIAVLDYGTGNVRSVTQALEAVADKRTSISLSHKPKILQNADKIVFPGQGAIGQCMDYLSQHGIDEVILECAKNKPFLGLCLGLQILLEHSEEAKNTKGLGIIPGQVVQFARGEKDEQNNRYKIPQMGWNQVSQTNPHTLWKYIPNHAHFYFAHSYYAKPKSQTDIAGQTDYTVKYASAIARDNLFAVQFHPEKSQQTGLQLLKNFVEW